MLTIEAWTRTCQQCLRKFVGKPIQTPIKYGNRPTNLWVCPHCKTDILDYGGFEVAAIRTDPGYPCPQGLMDDAKKRRITV